MIIIVSLSTLFPDKLWVIPTTKNRGGGGLDHQSDKNSLLIKTNQIKRSNDRETSPQV